MGVIDGVIKKIFGSKHERDIKAVMPLVAEINRIYPTLSDWPEERFLERTEQFRKELEELKAEIRKAAEEGDWDRQEFRKNFRTEIDEYLNEILPEAFAMVKEACRRLCGKTWDVVGIPTTWEMVPYDVQLIGGIALHQARLPRWQPVKARRW